jgi:hypothetical protein
MGHKAPVTVSITKKKKKVFGILLYSHIHRHLTGRKNPCSFTPTTQSFITTHHQPQQQQQFKCVDTAYLTLSQAPSSASPTSRWLYKGKQNKTMILSHLYDMTLKVPFTHTETELRK